MWPLLASSVMLPCGHVVEAEASRRVEAARAPSPTAPFGPDLHEIGPGTRADRRARPAPCPTDCADPAATGRLLRGHVPGTGSPPTSSAAGSTEAAPDRPSLRRDWLPVASPVGSRKVEERAVLAGEPRIVDRDRCTNSGCVAPALDHRPAARRRSAALCFGAHVAAAAEALVVLGDRLGVPG